VPELRESLPGIHNEGFLATYQRVKRAPFRSDWQEAGSRVADGQARPHPQGPWRHRAGLADACGSWPAAL